MLLNVKFLGHEIGYNTIKPIHSKFAAIHKIPSSTGRVALMSFIGALNFYTKFIENRFTIFYTKTLRGNGQMNMNVFFKN